MTLSAASGLGVLTTDTDTPVVTETSVDACFFQSFKIVTKFGVKGSGDEMGTFTSGKIFLVVQHPAGYFKGGWVGDHGNHGFCFVFGQFTGTFVGINFSFFQDDVSESTTDTWDFSDGVQDFGVTVNVGIEDTEDVLEFFGLHKRRHDESGRIKKRGQSRGKKKNVSCIIFFGVGSGRGGKGKKSNTVDNP